MTLTLDFDAASTSTASSVPRVWLVASTSPIRTLGPRVVVDDTSGMAGDTSREDTGVEVDFDDPRDLVIAQRRSSGAWLTEDDLMRALDDTDE